MTITFRKMTPVLVVDAVEPCLAFWVDRLGFAVEHRIPGDDGTLIFGSVHRDGIELMYQTRASVLAGEDPAAGEQRQAELAGHSVALYFEVSDFDAVEAALAGARVMKPRHETFYGTVELYVREPGGNMVGFAAPVNTPATDGR